MGAQIGAALFGRQYGRFDKTQNTLSLRPSVPLSRRLRETQMHKEARPGMFTAATGMPRNTVNDTNAPHSEGLSKVLVIHTVDSNRDYVARLLRLIVSEKPSCKTKLQCGSL